MIGKKIFRRKDAGVSAVIGVILMVAITVAIAATVYVYVSGMLEPEDTELYIEGTVMTVAESGTYNDNATIIYNITLDTAGNTYQMMFRTDDAVVPPTQVTLQFFYEVVTYDNMDIFDVYKIVSL